MKTGIIVLIVIVLLALWIGGTFVGHRNEMVRKRETVNAAWSQVDVVLQRRADLIPNLVETVKGFATHEEKVFGDIAAARAAMAGAKTPQEKIAANGQLDSALSRLLVVVENYPQLRSNENFLRLQDELAGTENRIAIERRRYNETVQDYNTYISLFPNNIVAKFLRIHPQRRLLQDGGRSAAGSQGELWRASTATGSGAGEISLLQANWRGLSRRLDTLLLADRRVILGDSNSARSAFERLLQVGEKVVHIFDSHRQANQVRRQRTCLTNLRRNACMRHAPRQADRGIHAAKAHADAEQLRRLHHLLRHLERARLKADDRPCSTRLLHMQFVTGMACQTWVMHALHRRMRA